MGNSMSTLEEKIEKMLMQISDKELSRNWVVGRSVFKIRALLMHLALYLKSNDSSIKKYGKE